MKITNSTQEGLHSAITDEKLGYQWPIRRTLAQAQNCDLVVSVDTGVAWAVAMLAMPKVIMVSHASPLNITHGWVNTETLHADQVRVPCAPCHRLHDSFATCNKAPGLEAAACMADIQAEDVVRAVKRGLASLWGNSEISQAQTSDVYTLSSKPDARQSRLAAMSCGPAGAGAEQK